MTDDLHQLKRILEGALLAADDALSIDYLGQLFLDNERPPNADIRKALKAIAEDHAGRGFELKEVASGWRFQVCQDLSPWIGRLWEERPQRYSRALLETLALVAYRQPVTRGEIEQVRGVSVSSNIIRTLLEREWIKVVGHRDVTGKPAMYATTKTFLDYFNLKNLSELPTLSEIRDLDKINAELEFGDEALEPVRPLEGSAIEREESAVQIEKERAEKEQAEIEVTDTEQASTNMNE